MNGGNNRIVSHPSFGATSAAAAQTLPKMEKYQDHVMIHFSDSGFGSIPSITMNMMPQPTMASTVLSPGTSSVSQGLNTLSLKTPVNSCNNLVSIGSSSSFVSQGTLTAFSPATLQTPNETTATTSNAIANGSPAIKNLPVATTYTHRKKRLERNRESAKLSRRRRKQYLEELEERVMTLSARMDLGRREHVARALSTLTEARDVCLALAERDLFSLAASSSGEGRPGGVLVGHDVVSSRNVSRTSDEMRVVVEFQREQLRSLVVSPYSKLVLWLTLQNEVYFRGGRSSSDRLSAARIGEKVSIVVLVMLLCVFVVRNEMYLIKVMDSLFRYSFRWWDVVE